MALYPEYGINLAFPWKHSGESYILNRLSYTDISPGYLHCRLPVELLSSDPVLPEDVINNDVISINKSVEWLKSTWSRSSLRVGWDSYLI